jgi:hypothetical protein
MGGRAWVVVALAMGAPACALIADIRDLKLEPSDGGGDAQVADESEGGDGASPGGDASEDSGASDGRVPTDGRAGADAGDSGLAEGGWSDGALDTGSASDGPQEGSDAGDSAAAIDSGSGDSGAPDAPDAPDAPGAPDAAAEAGPCIMDLSGIGTGDFRIAFSVATTQTGQVALLNQRNVCFFGLFWDLRIYSGTLDVQTDDGTNFVEFQTTVPPLVNDGNLHAVVIRRVARVITVTIDGTPAGTSTDVTSFASLPPFQTGHDPCQSGPNKDGTVAFAGTLENVCMTAP